MAKCDVCGKGPMTGNNISHSHLKTRRVWQPNIHRTKIKIKGRIRKANVCTNCLKSRKIQKIV